MPQSGFHALAAVALADRTRPRHPAWAAGVVLGALLPDIDIALVGILRVTGHDLPALHRGATHSLFAGVMLITAGAMLRSRASLAAWLAALGLGALSHIVLDVFFWFSGVDLLWPLSAGWGWPRLDLWSPVKLPPLLGNADFVWTHLAAWEAIALALYFMLLGRRARRAGTSGRWPRLVRALGLVSWMLFPLYVASGALLDRRGQEFAVYGVWILLLFPAALAATLVLRQSLAAAAVPAAQESAGVVRSSRRSGLLR